MIEQDWLGYKVSQIGLQEKVHSFKHKFVAKLRKYRIHILSFLEFDYRDALLIILYLVVLGIIISKIRLIV